MPTKLDWDDLRYLYVAINAGGIGSAATSLNVSPTTVTRRIQALEKALGLKLFSRTGAGLQATEQAAAVYQRLSGMIEAEAAINRWKAAIHAPELGTVRVLASTWMSHLLTMRHSELAAELPGVDLEIVTSDSMTSIEFHEADLALGHHLPDTQASFTRLPSMNMAVYGSASYVAAKPVAFTDKRATDCEWIGYSANMSHLAEARALIELGVTTIRLRCTTCLQVLHATKSGLGLSLLPNFVAKDDNDLMQVSPLIHCDGTEVFLSVNAGVEQVPRVRRVVDSLQAWLGRSPSLLSAYS